MTNMQPSFFDGTSKLEVMIDQIPITFYSIAFVKILV